MFNFSDFISNVSAKNVLHKQNLFAKTEPSFLLSLRFVFIVDKGDFMNSVLKKTPNKLQSPENKKIKNLSRKTFNLPDFYHKDIFLQ